MRVLRWHPRSKPRERGPTCLPGRSSLMQSPLNSPYISFRLREVLCSGFYALGELVDLVLDPVHRDIGIKLEVTAAAREAHEAFVCPFADGQVDGDGLGASGVLDLLCLEGQATSASKASEERRGDDHQEERVGN